MIKPGPAPVRPRVLLPDGSAPLPLDDEVLSRLEAGHWGLIELVGRTGCGKSTALAYLAERFGDEPALVLVDRPEAEEIAELIESASECLVICASPTQTLPPGSVERWRVSPWGLDECIEYLLAMHRSQCARVMARIQSGRQRLWLSGVAELWRAVLDRLAADGSLPDVKTALRADLLARLADPTTLAAARECCFVRTAHGTHESPAAAQLWQHGDPKLLSLLRHEQSQTLLAAEHLADELLQGNAHHVLAMSLPEALVHEAAYLMRNDPRAHVELDRVFAAPNRPCDAMAASLLQSMGAGWLPKNRRGRAPCLSGAYLSGAKWPGVRLSHLDISHSDLTGADLSEAQLAWAVAHMARMTEIRLHGARLDQFFAVRALLADADLSHVRAAAAFFRAADLRGATLEGALLRDASFIEADLRGARFCRADLTRAYFRESQLDEADFSGANLSLADFTRCVLRGAEFSGAKLVGALLVHCDLEGMYLPGTNFEDADLGGACLTATRMPGARFRNASLTNAGLADIEWEGADLRDANLNGSTFHLGSSRSGLVGSPIASEGSRTGFYTDEFHEQDFKAPEEIRKANLCNADLRGAKVENVDFYLVDLRGARYTREQEAHFRRSGAILETRV
jgi:uncharacterized protein YjbI with pentapeptide repeats